MKTSVLIAAHQAEARIANALASVRAQAQATWELVVVEYGPVDGTEAIVRDFGASSPRPVSYEKLGETDGSAAARNRLLELAKHDVVAFLEPCDAWTPRHLAHAAHHISAGADIVISDIRFIDRKHPSSSTEITVPAQLTSNATRTLFTRDVPGSISSAAFRRELAACAGGFDTRFRVNEGRDFWLRCALQNARFVPTRRATCECDKAAHAEHALLLAEDAVLFYEKHRDLAAVPAALRRRLLAASLVTHGRLLRPIDQARASRCFLRAWSLQPVHVQTLGQFALMGWRSNSESRRPSNESIPNGP